MDIYELSTSLSQTKLLNEVGTQVLSHSMQDAPVQAVKMLESMPTIHDVYPNIGGNIDIAL